MEALWQFAQHYGPTGGILVLVFLLVATGQLVPRHWVKLLLADKDAQIQQWHDAHDMNAQVAQELLESARTQTHLLQEIQQHHHGKDDR